MAKQWDHSSGVRERLALLAEKGPGLIPHGWGYHPSRDFWYACGDDQRGNVAVRQEGSASLALISERWNLNRVQAMEFIGYPEAVR